MRKIKYLIIIFILTSGCGFNISSNVNENNFSIKELKTLGDNRVNFKIKNYLINNAKKNTPNTIILALNTKKTKTIKEKNIKNEITKYEIILSSMVEFYLVGEKKKNVVNVKSTGNYIVEEKNYSATLNNEKSLLDNLTENISEKILDEINIRLNDN